MNAAIPVEPGPNDATRFSIGAQHAHANQRILGDPHRASRSLRQVDDEARTVAARARREAPGTTLSAPISAAKGSRPPFHEKIEQRHVRARRQRRGRSPRLAHETPVGRLNRRRDDPEALSERGVLREREEDLLVVAAAHGSRGIDEERRAGRPPGLSSAGLVRRSRSSLRCAGSTSWLQVASTGRSPATRGDRRPRRRHPSAWYERESWTRRSRSPSAQPDLP